MFWGRADEDSDVVVCLVLIVVRSRPAWRLRGTIGWVVVVLSLLGSWKVRRVVVVVGSEVVVVMDLVVGVVCGALVIAGGGGDARGGRGGGAGGGGGSSKSLGATSAKASLMKAFHVSAGIEPPVTRRTPLMSNSDVGLVLSPIHTDVESSGV